MPGKSRGNPFDLKKALLEACAVNERMNQLLLENLDERAWRAELPTGEGRTIAAIVARIHYVRHMWLTVSPKGNKILEKLDRNTCTRKQAMAAPSKSAEAIAKLLAAGLVHPEGRVRDFRPNIAGAFGYMIAHEARHRGQICLLAGQIRYPFAKEVSFGMWDSSEARKQCGFGK